LSFSRRAGTIGAVFVVLAACGWFAAALRPFSAASSAVTFSTAAAVLATSALCARLRAAAPESPVRRPPAGRAEPDTPAPSSDEPDMPLPTAPLLTSSSPLGPALGTGASAPHAWVRDRSLRLRGSLAWLLAVLFGLAVELWELAQSPRRLHPTLSSLLNDLVGPGHRLGRAAAFVCWGACGFVVASRGRRRA